MIGNVDGVDNDTICGWVLDPDEPGRRIPIEVFYNGGLLTTSLAAFHRPDLVKAGVGDGSSGFYVPLPALREPEEAEIVVRVTETGEQLGKQIPLSRLPKCSPSGVLAADALDLHAVPLHSLHGLTFDGAQLTISGIHLPP